MKNYQKLIIAAGILGASSFATLRSPYTYLTHKIASQDSTQLFVPEDMEVTLWAESPLFYNPTNMDIDAKGRVWVTEAKNYRNFKNDPAVHLHNDNGDRVIILEDTNQDGKADKSTVFVEDKDLVAPMGLAVVGNKAYVSAAPHMIVYTDTDGDDKADKKEVLLTGFGGLDHDHSLHSGVVAPDGNFLYNVGNAGPHHVKDKNGFELHSGSVYTGGTPYNNVNEGNLKSSDGQVWTGGMALKMTLDGKNTKVLGHNFRNSYEVAVDSYGNMFQNDNDDGVIACRTSFLMENGNAGFFSANGNRTWQADRRPGQDLVTAQWHSEDPGASPVGDITGAGSPTGVHVYEGDAFGDNFRGTLMSCEAGRNVIFGYKLAKKGAGFELNRQDLFSTQGKTAAEKYIWNQVSENKSLWFRPADVCTGIDGSLYIADWYDPVVGGHKMDDTKGYGRIYRITPKNKKLTLPKIDISTINGQINALCNPAQNVRYLGFEALKNQGEAAVADIQKLLNHANPYVQARAIWLLAQLGNKGIIEVKNLLKSDNENHRLVAFRALKDTHFDEAMAILANEKSADVLREMAIALKYKPFEKYKSNIAHILSQYHGNDPYLLFAIGTMAHEKQGLVYQLAKGNNHPQLNDMAFELHPTEALTDILAIINNSKTDSKEKNKMLTAIGFMNNEKAVTAMINLSKNSDAAVSKMAAWWVNFKKDDEWATLAKWNAMAETAQSATYKKLKALSLKLKDKTTPWEEKLKIAQQLAKDPEGGEIIMDLKANYRIGGKEMDAAIAKHIFDNPNANVRVLASQYFTRDGSESYNIGFISRTKGNQIEGRKSFAANCQNCHRHGEDGAEIGPDLTNIHKKYDKSSLLDHVINPSAAMVFGYETYTITTKKGEAYYGFLVGETSKLVTLKDIAGKITNIKKETVKSKSKMPNSLMPDPNSMGLKEQDLADISDYLLSFK